MPYVTEIAVFSAAFIAAYTYGGDVIETLRQCGPFRRLAASLRARLRRMRRS